MKPEACCHACFSDWDAVYMDHLMLLRWVWNTQAWRFWGTVNC